MLDGTTTSLTDVTAEAEQQAEDNGRQHVAPGGHTDAAQGDQFVRARQLAVGEQRAQQHGHGQCIDKKTGQAQKQDLQRRKQGQTLLHHLAHQIEHGTAGEQQQGEDGNTEQQRADELATQPAIQELRTFDHGEPRTIRG